MPIRTERAVSSLAFSHDGHFLAAHIDDDVRVWEMASGRHALVFRSGLALQALGALVLLAAPGPLGALISLAGLLAFEHAFVQAGQSVPLA